MILLPDDHWQIAMTSQKGRGIFATKDILPGVVIGDYIGKVLKTAEDDTSEKEGLYLMYYHDYASLYPTDINAPGIHLINHSCAPNCWLYTYKGHTLFFTLRKIFAGEELTASYLLSPDGACMPCRHICRCGIKYCSGTMHLSKEPFAQWNSFNEEQAKKTKRSRIRYGYELPKLSMYPDGIPDHPIYKLMGSLEKSPFILKDKQLIPLEKMRSLIRETGQTLLFSSLKIRVFGMHNTTLFSESVEERG